MARLNKQSIDFTTNRHLSALRRSVHGKQLPASATQKYSMRVNKLNDDPAFLIPSDASKPYLTGGTVVNPVLPGQALPITNDWRRAGTYRSGDGEVIQLQRPGSERAFTLPSRGFRC